MTTTGPGRAATVASFLLVTGSTLVGGLLNAGVIALAARRGELAEIAAYTVMMAVLAVVGVAVGGGSAMLYLSGGEADRRAVRSLRWLLVVPSLLLAAVGVVTWYGARGYAVPALAATAAVFVANNVAELSLAQLHRDQRFHRVAAATLLSKVVALAVFLPGAPVTAALLVGAVVNLAASELLAGAHSPLLAGWRERPTVAAARRATRSGRGLYVYTLAELFALRVPSIGLSLTTSPTVMGHFGTIATAFGALLSVFQSGMNMVLSLRARVGAGSGPRADAEALSLGAGLLGAAGLAVAAPWLTGDVLALGEPAAAGWLQVLGAALPLILVNRIVATHAIAAGRHADAARIACGLAAATTATLAVAVPLAGPLGGSLATLVGEALVAAVLLARMRPGQRTGAPSRKSK